MNTKQQQPRVAIVGGGPSGLFAAEILGQAGIGVDLFERMPSLGRKFLMAGRGGLNLTHAEPLERFLTRYEPVAPLLTDAVRAFPPDDMRQWADGLGQATFIGSSGRIFPEALKASPLLRAWLARLDGLGVRFHLRHELRGWNRGALVFASPLGEIRHGADATLLALGGASWPRLGSDGRWTQLLADEGLAIAPLRPANAGATLGWTPHFSERHAGSPLKRIVIHLGRSEAHGEAMITASGLEGGAIYALGRPIRQAIDAKGFASITIDLKPDFRPEFIARRLSETRTKDSFASRLRKAAGLQPNAVALINEAMILAKRALPKDDPMAIAELVKALPLRITGMAGIERAISTAGGVAFEGLNPDFMVKSRPGLFVAGEMLDWEAPTGGYLLQACFASGKAAAEGMIRFLSEKP
jgi:uncharacterized flavoprotein (TIGR03862 family)